MEKAEKETATVRGDHGESQSDQEWEDWYPAACEFDVRDYKQRIRRVLWGSRVTSEQAPSGKRSFRVKIF